MAVTLSERAAKHVANYIAKTYGVAVDKSGRDLSRACFLPHDPNAYLNPAYNHSTG